ncbi:MAG: hypothetical protein RR338_01345 [Clostridia bacterium]
MSKLKKFELNKNSKIAFTIIGLIALMLLAITLSAFSVLLFVYAIVLAVAWKSAMAFCMLFGASTLALGFFIVSADTFNRLVKTYRQKYGKSEANDGKTPSVKAEKKPKSQKIVTVKGKKIDIKKFVTAFNIACVFLVSGTIFVASSALLHGIEREQWVLASASYMAENGYYSHATTLDISFAAQTQNTVINKIEIDLKVKNAVVIYVADNTDTIRVTGYKKYKEQMSFSKVANGNDTVVSVGTTNLGHTLNIVETPSPMLNRSIDKMLFFMFDENEAEKQLRIYIPQALKDSVEITGNHIVAK